MDRILNTAVISVLELISIYKNIHEYVQVYNHRGIDRQHCIKGFFPLSLQKKNYDTYSLKISNHLKLN